MKRKHILQVVLALFLIIAGCIPSLHPLYTDETLIFDEKLIGKWTSTEEDDFGIWQFSKTGEKEYELKIIQDGKQGRFVAHLLELDGKRYLDLYPGEEKMLESLNDIYKNHLVPAHTFMRIYQTDPNLQLQWLDIEGTLEDDPNLLRHEKINDDDSIVITATTDELQKFVIEHANDLAEKPAELIRLEPIFTDDNITFEEKLLGKWQGKNGTTAEFSRKVKGYRIIYCDEDNVLDLTACIVKLHGLQLLAVYFSEPTDNEVKNGLHLIPDIFVVVDQIEPKLLLRIVEYEELSELLKQDTGKLQQQDTKIDYTFEGIRIEP